VGNVKARGGGATLKGSMSLKRKGPMNDRLVWVGATWGEGGKCHWGVSVIEKWKKKLKKGVGGRPGKNWKGLETSPTGGKKARAGKRLKWGPRKKKLTALTGSDLCRDQKGGFEAEKWGWGENPGNLLVH